MKSLYEIKVNAVAQCVLMHPSLESAYDVIRRNESCDYSTKAAGIRLAVDNGWATEEEAEALGF